MVCGTISLQLFNSVQKKVVPIFEGCKVYVLKISINGLWEVLRGHGEGRRQLKCQGGNLQR